MQNHDSDSPGTGESQYPSGRTQFPSTGSIGARTSTTVGAGGVSGYGLGIFWAMLPLKHSGFTMVTLLSRSGLVLPPTRVGCILTLLSMQLEHPQRERQPVHPNLRLGTTGPTWTRYTIVWTTTPNPTTPFSFSDFDDNITLEQMGFGQRWEHPVPAQAAPAPSRRGGGSTSRRGGGRGGRGRASSVYYTRGESIVVARTWISVSEDPIVENDQMDSGLWALRRRHLQ